MKFLERFKKADSFTLDVSYFPEITKELLSTELILEFGVLPLGYKTGYRFFSKKKVLNIGVLDSARRGSLEKVERAARQRGKFDSIQVYDIEVSQYLKVLKEIYGLSKESILDRQSVNACITEFYKKQEEAKQMEEDSVI